MKQAAMAAGAILSLVLSGAGLGSVVFAADDIVVSRPHQTAVSRLYLGAAAGYVDYREMKDGDAGFSLYGGYRLDEVLALEIGWSDLGNVNKGGDEVEISVASAAVVGSLPLRTDLTGFARLGLVGWNYELTRSGTKEKDSGTDLWFGLGLDYDIGGRSTVRFAADYLTMEPELSGIGQLDERLLFFSVGFVYKP